MKACWRSNQNLGLNDLKGMRVELVLVCRKVAHAGS